MNEHEWRWMVVPILSTTCLTTNWERTEKWKSVSVFHPAVKILSNCAWICGTEQLNKLYTFNVCTFFRDIVHSTVLYLWKCEKLNHLVLSTGWLLLRMIIVDALAGRYPISIQSSNQKVRLVPISNQLTHKATVQDSCEAACLALWMKGKWSYGHPHRGGVRMMVVDEVPPGCQVSLCPLCPVQNWSLQREPCYSSMSNTNEFIKFESIIWIFTNVM